MNISVNFTSDKPVYVQIYEILKEKIICGAFPCGARLPSKRTLAEDCGVSIVTIEHAYSLLRDEDYCETRERSGYYVIYSPERSFPSGMATIKTMPKSAGNVAVSADIPFSAFAGRMRKVLSDYGERVLMKSQDNGCPELREAISRYLMRSRNINVSPEQVIIGSGAEYLYGICIQMLGRDRTIALENPSYEKIRLVYTANGAVCDMLEMDSEGIRPEELTRTKASVLHVTPFNSFPSNITASAERRAEYIKWAEKRNAFIIEDDYDSEFILTGTAPETLFSMCPDGNVIYINTFSKTIAPSVRAGYMLLPEHMLPMYAEKTGFYSCTVPMLEQYFLADWIDSGDFERNINRMRHKRNAGK
ncbi:MAG: PLP-dependent aminotransferase family protein [Ruminococcus flavefaciens]|nr:PLP-dependent aminotransferase family protein [Ruminococcus flavefaciens]